MGSELPAPPADNWAILTPDELPAFSEDAIVDTHDKEEQQNGFFSMIADNLMLPFETEVLGVKVQVVEVDQDQLGAVVAVCERNGKQQRIGVLDLTLPSPPPQGAEWLEAYRLWSSYG